MNNNIFKILFLIFNFLLININLYASESTNYKDWTDYTGTSGRTYYNATDYYSWSQEVYVPFGATVDSASIILKYALANDQNGNYFSENWQIAVKEIAPANTSYTVIRNLDTSSGIYWQEREVFFTNWFKKNVMKNDFEGGIVKLGFYVNETNYNSVQFLIRLDESTVSIKYTPIAPVPVPSAALLLGSSLLGLIGFNSRRP